MKEKPLSSRKGMLKMFFNPPYRYAVPKRKRKISSSVLSATNNFQPDLIPPCLIRQWLTCSTMRLNTANRKAPFFLKLSGSIQKSGSAWRIRASASPKNTCPDCSSGFTGWTKSRSRNLGGTGLGLAIVKHIAQAHGGRITVESTLGVGSVFTIHLPQK